MSCDFMIFNSDTCLSDEEVGQIYEKVCEGKDAGLPFNISIDSLYHELTSQHPEIDDVPEDQIDDVDLCPWSIAFDRSSSHLLISCVWSKADYVTDLLSKLAQKHELAIYYTFAEVAEFPDRLIPKPWWKFW